MKVEFTKNEIRAMAVLIKVQLDCIIARPIYTMPLEVKELVVYASTALTTLVLLLQIDDSESKETTN